MLKNKAILAIGVIFLFITLSMTPATANFSSRSIELREREMIYVNEKINELIDRIEMACSRDEVLRIISEFFEDGDDDRFPIIKAIISKIMDWLMNQSGFFFMGDEFGDFFDNDGGGLFRASKKHFIVSYGSYNRLNPRKENEVKLFKQGFAFWRYSGKSKIFNGRTLILERQPFGVKQRVTGKQFGFIAGFKGLFIDVESKLTGNSWVVFMGPAVRARAFDLTPLSK